MHILIWFTPFQTGCVYKMSNFRKPGGSVVCVCACVCMVCAHGHTCVCMEGGRELEGEVQ